MAQFTNQAQLRYGNEVKNSNIAVGEILEVLSMTKTAVRDTYRSDGNIVYIISIRNAGSVPVTGLTLTDDLGTYSFGADTLTPLDYVSNSVKYYSNGILQAAPAVTASPPLRIQGLTVPANGNITLVYETTVNAYAPLSVEADITNTVIASGTGITPITATETVNAEVAPLLSITKSISPVPVTANSTVTYTFLIQNLGSQAADGSSEVVITDTFDPRLSNLTVTFNGTVLEETTDYTYDETTGVFTTVAGRITVPAATFTQDSETGEWGTDPGLSTLIITGTI